MDLSPSQYISQEGQPMTREKTFLIVTESLFSAEPLSSVSNTGHNKSLSIVPPTSRYKICYPTEIFSHPYCGSPAFC